MLARVLCVVFGTIVFAACGCASSSTPQHDVRSISATQTTGAVEGQPRLQMPITIHGSRATLTPFAIVSEKGLFERNDPYARAVQSANMRVRQVSYDAFSVIPNMGSSVRWHNVLMTDLNSGEEWLLLQQRGIIGEWNVLAQHDADRKDYRVRGMLFIAVLADTNKDGSLDDRDARVAILTDPSGRGARAITPPDAQVWSTRYDPETDTLFLLVARDTNGDGVFDLNDRVVPYMLPLTATGDAKPVVSEALLGKAEQLLK